MFEILHILKSIIYYTSCYITITANIGLLYVKFIQN